MRYKIEEIEGIGPTFAKKLSAANIDNTETLLEKCCTPSGRKNVAKETGLNESQLLKWSNMADLMRVSGIGSEYSELLEAAGVDTIKERRNRNAANLAGAMKTANEKRKLTRTVPGETTVGKWIDSAKTITPKITY